MTPITERSPPLLAGALEPAPAASASAARPRRRWRYPFTRRTPLRIETIVNPLTLRETRRIVDKRPLFWIVGLIAIAALPPLFGGNSTLSAAIIFAMYAAINVVWMLTLATAGIFSLATFAIVGVGAYGAAYLSIQYGLPWWGMLLMSPLFGLAFGFLVAIPAIRLEGFYYALLTVGINELCRSYVVQSRPLGAANNGLYGADTFVPASLSERGGLLLTFYASVLLLIGALALYRWVDGQRLGRLLRAAPENHEAFAEALGIDYRTARIKVFLISAAALGGIGGFYAIVYKGASPSLFGLDNLLLLLAMVVIGGIGTTEGAVVGTFIVVLFNQVFIDLGPVRLMIVGLIMLGTVLFLRGGLMGIPAQFDAWRRKTASERRSQLGREGGGTMPGDSIEIRDKQTIAAQRFDDVLRRELKALITEKLIEEHRTTEGKRRSDALERVLTYFRRAAVADKYAILAEKPFERYRIVAMSGRRGVPPRAADDQIYVSEEAALHGVFLKRVHDLLER
jgi:branched-chain amino acid transport system permease protein